MLAHVHSSAPDFSLSLSHHSRPQNLRRKLRKFMKRWDGETVGKETHSQWPPELQKEQQTIVAVGPVGRASGFKPITETLMWYLAQWATFSYLLPCIAFSRRSFVNNGAGARALERIREGIWTRSVLPRECIFLWWRWNQQRYHQNNVTCHRSNGTLFAIVLRVRRQERFQLQKWLRRDGFNVNARI